ncbi:serine hydrolase domain-containing protein [Actinoplanes sp. NPDC048791]|uniref:serine hydrolase domain-containing protein n=1 Tax=Actinoplanes sp. NPDC048791 TaxID=3154623 RepID=UPI0033C2D791
MIRHAGYGNEEPLIVGTRRAGGPPVYSAQGGLTADTAVPVASLSKQITAACVALLGQQRRLDTASTLGEWLPELPEWAHGVRVQHLLNHTSGLPELTGFWDDHLTTPARTATDVIRALTAADGPVSPPGTQFRYCSVGYLCLAVVIHRASGQPLTEFARTHIFEPLGMPTSHYLFDIAGDGGVQSTAEDLMRWNLAIERDELGISKLLHTPGRLNDGTPLVYGWGIDVLEHKGQPLHKHGGRWPGVSTQLGRLPERGASFVILALDDDEARTVRLMNALIEDLGRDGQDTQR